MRTVTMLLTLVTVVDARPANAQDCSEVGELGFPLIEHSCFHAELGPFLEVTATAGTSATAGTADVDHVHTHYTIALTAASPNVVTYTPVRTGTWVAFGNGDPALRFIDDTGAELPVLFRQDDIACEGLARAQAYSLEAFRRYEIVFDASPASRTILVLEKISDFDTAYGLDADGDGTGGSDDVVSTPCAPPPGYLPSTDDCDDDAPRIHPGAPEQCDGIDDDCDGNADEGVCVVTGGGCRSADGGGLVLALAMAALAWHLRRRVRARWLPWVLVALATPRAAGAEVCEHLGPTIVDHTCLHARHGPFEDVTAGSPGSSPQGNLDSVHTLHRIALPPTDDAYGGWVSYRPARSGDWAIYLGTDVPVTVRDPDGAAVPWNHDDRVPGCPHLARVRAARLDAGVTYRVELGPTTASRVDAAFEYVDDFVVVWGRDLDGDGFGASEETRASACVLPAGYVPNDGDCDDGDGAISPLAPERCDAVDSNCNGSGDDVGLACLVGRGRCAAAGVASCGEPGAPAQCDAMPATGEPEACNGVDDDCDSVDDVEEPGLCATADRPRCVGDSRGGRLCGCETDADCGSPTSARLCRLEGDDQRCVTGCVDGFGRNGCGAGEHCSSRDPAAPGTCLAGSRPEPTDGGCGCNTERGAGPNSVLVVIGLVLAMRLRRRRRTAP